VAEEDAFLSLNLPLNGNGSDVGEVLVQVRSRKGQVSGSQLRTPCGENGVSLGENGTPRRPLAASSAGGGDSGQLHSAFYGNGGHLLREMDQIANKSARQ
jgi:hypothetical protein